MVWGTLLPAALSFAGSALNAKSGSDAVDTNNEAQLAQVGLNRDVFDQIQLPAAQQALLLAIAGMQDATGNGFQYNEGDNRFEEYLNPTNLANREFQETSGFQNSVSGNNRALVEALAGHNLRLGQFQGAEQSLDELSRGPSYNAQDIQASDQLTHRNSMLGAYDKIAEGALMQAIRSGGDGSGMVTDLADSFAQNVSASAPSLATSLSNFQGLEGQFDQNLMNQHSGLSQLAQTGVAPQQGTGQNLLAALAAQMKGASGQSAYAGQGVTAPNVQTQLMPNNELGNLISGGSNFASILGKYFDDDRSAKSGESFGATPAP